MGPAEPSLTARNYCKHKKHEITCQKPCQATAEKEFTVGTSSIYYPKQKIAN